MAEGAPPEQVYLVGPVVNAESEESNEGPDWNQGSVQKGEPHRLHDLRVPLPHHVL